MKNLLQKSKSTLWWYDDDGVLHDDGSLPTGISGDVSGLRGYVSGLSGDVTGIRGDVTGLSGDATGIRGNVDDCEITDEEREKGVDVKALVK